MSNKIIMISEQFEKDSTGESVEGITIMIDGVLQQFLSIIMQKNTAYKSNLEIIQDALMKGLEKIKNES
jgi:hypothetical protein